MVSKNWCVVLAFSVLALIEANCAFAGGHGGHGGSSRPRQPVRFQNNRFLGSNLAFESPFWGFGGFGYGWGDGWGLYPGWEYQVAGVPYFAQFPPVYYKYADDMPVVKPSVRPSWTDSEGPQATSDSTAYSSPPRPPLRIVNPYYTESTAGKP